MLKLRGSAGTPLGHMTQIHLRLEEDVLQEMSDQSLATARNSDGTVVLATLDAG